MDFTQKYVLVELLPGDGTQSYRARQTNTGRDVTVHLLVGGKTPENEAVLARLRGMQPQSMAKLIEVGTHQGTTFGMTVAVRGGLPQFLGRLLIERISRGDQHRFAHAIKRQHAPPLAGTARKLPRKLHIDVVAVERQKGEPRLVA